MQTPGRSGSRNAASFIEVMFVVIIMAVCILPFMTYFNRETRGTAHTQSRSIGLALADHTMERFRATDFGKLKEKFGGGFTSNNVDNDELIGIDKFPEEMKKKMEADKVKREVQFEVLEDPFKSGATEPSRLGRLTVKVSWKAPNLPEASLKLTKVVLDYDNL